MNCTFLITGDISVKLDVFSFGVILLELLTGLAPFDANREHPDLLAHVTELLFDVSDDEESDEENDQLINQVESKLKINRLNRINQLLDKNVQHWDLNSVELLFALAHEATQERKRKRPSMDKIVERLNSLSV